MVGEKESRRDLTAGAGVPAKMSAVNVNRINAPQAFVSSYAPRIRNYGNSLLTPVQPQLAIPPIRTTKRGTTAINYAEEFDDDSIEDSDGPRRQTGLRTAQQRRDLEAEAAKAAQKELGREAHAPVDVQGIWREWMGKPKRVLTEKQMNVQSALPTTLIPIRIDLEVPAFRPEAALPTPNNAKDFGIDENLPAYKAPEPTPQYRLKDSFLWNLHEALITPDQFAKTFVDELDFPVVRKQAMVIDIANQIRQQLEEHASTALHPLFQPAVEEEPAPTTNAPTPAPHHALSQDESSTPLQPGTPGLLQPPQTNGGHFSSDPSTPMPNGATTPSIAVTAQPLPRDASLSQVHNPPDTHRCVLTLSINMQNRLYTDKFEWSLMHPPGFAEVFAKQTCADLGLNGEWVPSMAHAIYEASLRLKKDMIDNGGTLVGVVGSGIDRWGVVDNEACEFHGTAESALGVGAGWRFDEDDLGLDWEPKIEVLSKEEIEKREGDRERQLRRARRETARFTTTYALAAQSSGVNDYFSGGLGSSVQAIGGGDDERMGRGERSKKKRRFRSLSPIGRDTPEVAGFGGTTQQLTEGERGYWHCDHCRIWGTAVWGVRDGPRGPRVSSWLIRKPTSFGTANSLNRNYATIAASCMKEISVYRLGTTIFSPPKEAKQPRNRRFPNFSHHRSVSSRIWHLMWHHSRRAHHLHVCNNITTLPHLRPTCTREHLSPPAVKAKYLPVRWQILSTTPSQVKISIGQRSPNRESGNDYKISSTAASIANGGWQRKVMEAVVVIILAPRA